MSRGKGRAWTQSELGSKLEEYYSKTAKPNARAPWEDDKPFMNVALVRWPVDCESCAEGGYQSSSARQRMRLRHEGYRMIVDTRRQVEALAFAGQAALLTLSGKQPAASASEEAK